MPSGSEVTPHDYTHESRPQLRPAPHSEIEKAGVLTLATVRVCIHVCDPPGLWKLPIAQKHPKDFARYSVRVYHAINYARSPREHECGSIKRAKPRAPYRPSSRRLHCYQAALKTLYSQTHKHKVDRRSAARISPHSHTRTPRLRQPLRIIVHYSLPPTDFDWGTASWPTALKIPFWRDRER